MTKSRAAYFKKWYAAHRDQVAARTKKWKDAHRDLVRAANREYMRLHPEAARAATARYAAAHPERVRSSYGRWLAANREADIARTRRWQKANPDKVRVSSSRSRARRKAAPVEPFTVAQWNEVVTRYGGLCAYCRVKPWEHQDHVVPLSRGGKHAITNVVPACADCNQKKHARTWRPAA